MLRHVFFVVALLNSAACTESYYLGGDAGPRRDVGEDTSSDAMDAPPMTDVLPVDTGPIPQCGEGPREAELRFLVNQERAREGLVQLRCTERMTEVARAHAADMCERNYFNDISRDGRNVGDRLRDAGVVFGFADENIGRQERTARGMLSRWMRQDEFRRTILGPSIRRTGISHTPCRGRYLWVQVFTD